MILDIILIITFTLIFLLTYYKKFPYISFVFFIIYIVYIYIGAILMYYDDMILKDQSFDKMVMFVRLGFGCIVISIILGHSLFKRQSIINKDLINGRNLFRDNAMHLFAFVAVFITLLYILRLDSNPFLVMISNPDSYAMARQEVTTTMKYFGFYSQFLYFFLPLAVLYYYFSENNRNLFFISLFVLIVALMSTGQKSPVVNIIILLVMAYSLKRKSFDYYRGIVYFSIMLFLLVVLVVYQNMHLLYEVNTDTLIMALEGLQSRIFYSPTRNLVAYMEYFPNIVDHLYFTKPPMPPDQLIYEYIHPNDPYTGTANTVSLGNIYARFGDVLTVMSIFFILTFSIVVFDIKFFNFMKTPFEYSIYVLFYITAINIIITDWFSVLPFFILACLSTYGGLYLIEIFSNIFLRGKHKLMVYAYNKYFLLLSVLAFLYIFQGQSRSLVRVLIG